MRKARKCQSSRAILKDIANQDSADSMLGNQVRGNLRDHFPSWTIPPVATPPPSLSQEEGKGIEPRIELNTPIWHPLSIETENESLNIVEMPFPFKDKFALIAEALKANPLIMTPGFLRLALHNSPPVHVVRFMLRLNPDAAAVPLTGPTALQVAVKEGCSLDVVEEIIRACPEAVFVGNGTYDPLTYAKIWNPDDSQLHELLGRPMSTWTTVENETENKKSRKVRHKGKNRHYSSETQPLLLPEEQEELKNVKKITACLIRAHKRQQVKDQKTVEKLECDMKAFEEKEVSARKAQANTMIRGVVDIFAAMSAKQDEQVMKLLDMREHATRLWVDSRLASFTSDLASSQEVVLSSEFRDEILEEMVIKMEMETRANASFREEAVHALRSLEKDLEITIAAQLEIERRMTPIVPLQQSQRIRWRFRKYPSRSNIFGSAVFFRNSAGRQHSQVNSTFKTRKGAFRKLF